MIINFHKIKFRYINRRIFGTQTTYFEMTLHVDIAFKVDSSLKVV